jgi:hypothetical protein
MANTRPPDNGTHAVFRHKRAAKGKVSFRARPLRGADAFLLKGCPAEALEDAILKTG